MTTAVPKTRLTRCRASIMGTSTDSVRSFGAVAQRLVVAPVAVGYKYRLASTPMSQHDTDATIQTIKCHNEYQGCERVQRQGANGGQSAVAPSNFCLRQNVPVHSP